jgi:hypothetical protein
MNETRVKGPHGALWKHQAIVIIPKRYEGEKVATSWLNNGCNNEIKIPTKYDADIILVDEIAHNTNAIAVVVR